MHIREQVSDNILFSLPGLIEPIESTSIEKDTVIFDETESEHIIQKGEHSIR